ncbi:molybdate ABC transporter substrate-binding protein [Knoellia sp. 3-2P3]|uniref:molybdate ABC transporter substrate-binding protein n=1 Tax=unclassified Knoellia TaxID=2618719 RepID=UPI0023DBABED|nr:molybdate ABC transporter substrate-binding protein [Knoellia sp. 3-2P3]MDF2091714.1 molybdate ABC transporter substrate-binding protein [Knoellia sp. 3-2P3]
MTRRGSTPGGAVTPAAARSVVLATLLTTLLATAGCGTGGRSAADGSGVSAAGNRETATVTVLAAASLTEPLTALAREYERRHDGVHVALSFGSSTTLAQQVAEGAPADAVAFAGTTALKLLPQEMIRDGGTATIARNTMEVATPPDNPVKVRSLADLGRPGLDVVLCASTVPCGAAADEVLERAGITPHVVSREVDVKATLAKVRLGEADAAVVYHSDVVSAKGSVHGVPIPEAQNTTLDYPLVWLDADPHTTGFVELARGPAGREALTAAGFLAP